jgi:hypothetical protein
MPGGIRQVRFRVKQMDLGQMEKDIKLLRKLDKIKVPIGRKGKNVPAKMTVRQKIEKTVKGAFKVE